MTLVIGGKDLSTTATGDGPVDATFNAVKSLYSHQAHLQLYQVHAVTEGTDAQATVSVRMEEDGNIATGQSADTDTVVASAKAYINALNRLFIRRGRIGEDKKEITYRDVSWPIVYVSIRPFKKGPDGAHEFLANCLNHSRFPIDPKTTLMSV